jgi:hypothetical protein
MTTSGHEVRPEEEAPMRYGGDVSSWVRGLAAFAAVMMVTVGVLQVLAGPLWAMLIIVLDVAVIWALCAYGRDQV